ARSSRLATPGGSRSHPGGEVSIPPELLLEARERVRRMVAALSIGAAVLTAGDLAAVAAGFLPAAGGLGVPAARRGPPVLSARALALEPKRSLQQSPGLPLRACLRGDLGRSGGLRALRARSASLRSGHRLRPARDPHDLLPAAPALPAAHHAQGLGGRGRRDL